MTIKNIKHGKPNSDPMTLFDKTTEEKKTFTVQDIAQMEGYWGERTIQRICEKQGYQKASRGKYNIPESDLHLFKRPDKIPKKKEGQPAKGAPNLLYPIDNKVSDKTNPKTTGSHEIIIEETEENAKKQPSNIDEMEKPEKPEPELKENPPKAKKRRRRTPRRTRPPKNTEPKNPIENWFRVNQRMEKWEHFTGNDNILKIFMYLLIRASYTHNPYTDRKGNRYELGKVITSIGKIAKATNKTPDEVRYVLEKLQETGEIKILSTSKDPTKGTTIHVVNYAYWQCKETNQPAVKTPRPLPERKADWNELTQEQREARTKEALENHWKTNK